MVPPREVDMLLNEPRTLERALADLIEHRKIAVLLADREFLDRMIGDLEAEINLRRRGTGDYDHC